MYGVLTTVRGLVWFVVNIGITTFLFGMFNVKWDELIRSFGASPGCVWVAKFFF